MRHRFGLVNCTRVSFLQSSSKMQFSDKGNLMHHKATLFFDVYECVFRNERKFSASILCIAFFYFFFNLFQRVENTWHSLDYNTWVYTAFEDTHTDHHSGNREKQTSFRIARLLKRAIENDWWMDALMIQYLYVFCNRCASYSCSVSAYEYLYRVRKRVLKANALLPNTDVS